MKSLLTVLLMTIAAPMTGSPTDRVILAAMKLSEESNYSWSTIVTDDAGTYEIDGKTETGSYSWQRQPMPRSLARRLGRLADRDLTAFFKGPRHYVIHTDSGWQTFNELPRRSRDWVADEGTQYIAIPVPPGLQPALHDPVSGEAWVVPAVIYVPVPTKEATAPHSNYQFALSLPHEELAIIVSSYIDMSVDAHTATGTLSNLGAQLLLVHDGHEYIKPLAATGAFKVWMKEGIVTKYHVELMGVVSVKKKRILIHQRSSTVVKEIGTTALAVPAEVRRKLGG